MRESNHFSKLLLRRACLFIFLVLAVFPGTAAAAKPADPPEEEPQLDNTIQTRSAGLAWGSPDGAHSVYAWPFQVVQMGHVIQSYQDYGGAPYFHHGIDMVAPNGTEVFTRSGGQVVNIQNYGSGGLYWEVAILDAEGYVWQYHHIDKLSIPSAVHQAYQSWQADHQHGGFILPDTKLGEIVYWPVKSFNDLFHHIHLNILAAGDIYLNPLEFHTLLPDTQPPFIQKTGLLVNNAIIPGGTITEPQIPTYGLYIHTGDLFHSPVYTLPPYKIAFSLDGAAWTTVWEFHTFPGGSGISQFVNDFYVVPPTCGDYDCRKFYIDLGFTLQGQRPFPSQNGSHTILVQVWDFNQNSAQDSYSWTVVHPSSVVYAGLSGAYTPAGNLIQWSTTSQGDALGFNLYRSESLEGQKTKINSSLIPRLNLNTAEYSYTDVSAVLGRVYWYWLEDEDGYGPTGVYYGPQIVRTGLALSLPLVIKGEAN